MSGQPGPYREVVTVTTDLLDDSLALQAFLDGRTIEHVELVAYRADWGPHGMLVSVDVLAMVEGSRPTPTAAHLILNAPPTDPPAAPAAGSDEGDTHG